MAPIPMDATSLYRSNSKMTLPILTSRNNTVVMPGWAFERERAGVQTGNSEPASFWAGAQPEQPQCLCRPDLRWTVSRQRLLRALAFRVYRNAPGNPTAARFPLRPGRCPLFPTEAGGGG